jgi:hypothetical protein
MNAKALLTPSRHSSIITSQFMPSPPPIQRPGIYTPESPTYLSISSGAKQPEKGSDGRFSDSALSNRRESRTFSTIELSTIDQKWGKLFDSEGTPTFRLGQVLRGIANYMASRFAI